MFARLGARGEGAFIPFVVLGDPDFPISRRIVESLIVSGADGLELGIPFSDPIADGPTIQSATVRALAAGASPAGCWRLLGEIRAAHPDLPVGLLVYSNLVDLDGFYGRAAEAGVDSVLVADVPTLEAGPYVEAALRAGVDPVMIAPPNADEARLREIARLSRGYTYVVSRSGVTGTERQAVLSDGGQVARLKALGAPPPVVGFGISQPEHVRQALAVGAAGAISGSAVVARVTEHLEDVTAMLDEVGAFVAAMKEATRAESASAG
jgi:tryptophan synthase alpha chain